jgi:hypothetical protein
MTPRIHTTVVTPYRTPDGRCRISERTCSFAYWKYGNTRIPFRSKTTSQTTYISSYLETEDNGRNQTQRRERTATGWRRVGNGKAE